jgi:PIN domain
MRRIIAIAAVATLMGGRSPRTFCQLRERGHNQGGRKVIPNVYTLIDPNVLVSALISPSGPPAQILSAWVHERFELVVSPALLAKAQDVLTLPVGLRARSEQTAPESVRRRGGLDIPLGRVGSLLRCLCLF